MRSTQEERLLSLDEDMPGDEPATLQDGVMRMLRLQDTRSYAAGVKDAEEKYKPFLDAAKVHQHRNMETGEVYPVGTYLDYCPQCQALRQLDKAP